MLVLIRLEDRGQTVQDNEEDHEACEEEVSVAKERENLDGIVQDILGRAPPEASGSDVVAEFINAKNAHFQFYMGS